MKVAYQDPFATLLQGDCLDVLAEMEPESVDCVVTSPPFWGLRKYSGEQRRVWGDVECEHEWAEEQPVKGPKKWDTATGEPYPIQTTEIEVSQGATCSRCGAWRGAYGLEPTVEMYVEHTLEVLRAIRRVLKDTGVVWWNLGDSYAGSGAIAGGDWRQSNVGSGGRWSGGPASTMRRHYPTDGLKPLDMALIPQRVALAAQADGWWVRSIVVWAKPNPMPESVSGWRWEQCKVKVKAGNTSVPQQTREPGKASWTVFSGQGTHRELLENPEWADCPGCPKCAPNDGLVLRKGSCGGLPAPMRSS